MCFIFVLLLIGMVNNTMLFFIMMLFFILVISLKIQTFLHAVRRMRWLFLSIFIIYAFGTPGELIPNFPVNFAPTFEGAQLGLVQVEKLLIALAALSLLLTSSPREKMLLGLYMLLLPFKFFGLNVERFAARLMLTLDYVEELAAKDNSSFSFKHLDQIDEYIKCLPQANVVTFQKLPFSLIDKLMIVLLSALFVFMIYRGFA
jgi:energy-coupling factor transport system permease protein